MGTISHLIPRGPDGGPDHLPKSHYLVSERFIERQQGGRRFMDSAQQEACHTQQKIEHRHTQSHDLPTLGLLHRGQRNVKETDAGGTDG